MMSLSAIIADVAVGDRHDVSSDVKVKTVVLSRHDIRIRCENTRKSRAREGL